MSDMPIHRIEIQRLTQAIEREPVAYLVARVAFVIPYWSGGLADRSARPDYGTRRYDINVLLWWILLCARVDCVGTRRSLPMNRSFGSA
jgi:hypothetical protein